MTFTQSSSFYQQLSISNLSDEHKLVLITTEQRNSHPWNCTLSNSFTHDVLNHIFSVSLGSREEHVHLPATTGQISEDYRTLNYH